jgi:putative ATP-binding cassette transporter
MHKTNLKNTETQLSITTLLYRNSPKLLIFAVTLGVVTGALYSLIIPFALHGIDGSAGALIDMGVPETLASAIESHPASFFFVTVALILCLKTSSVVLVNNIALDATAQLKIRLSKKINRMMIADVERVGFSKLLNVLMGDVNDVSSSAIAIPMLVVSLVSVAGVLGYLAVLEPYVFFIVLTSIVIGGAIYLVPVELASNLYAKARSLQDVIQEGVRGLVMGAYELKLGEAKSESFIQQEIIRPQKEYARLEKLAEAIHHFAGTSSDMIAFFTLGCLVFVLPEYMDFPDAKIYGVVMALLYIAGPLANILSIDLLLKKSRVAIRRIHELETYREEMVFDATGKNGGIGQWSEYSIAGATYSYVDEDNKQMFSLGPINLTFRRGQINFIVGGNGSGKSTLSKLLSLHYEPAEGLIFFDRVPINDRNIRDARLKISVIYSNYHLFSKIYPDDDAIDTTKLDFYLTKFGLKDKTAYVDGRFTTTKLSDGQRRRMALIVALLEDKDIYIFDEWAADQDPHFKRTFYEEILPELRAKNKLIIVITHDDRFFSCADLVLRMEHGRVVEEGKLDTKSTSEIHLQNSVIAAMHE